VVLVVGLVGLETNSKKTYFNKTNVILLNNVK